MQQPPTIGFLGPSGTFAHLATRQRFGTRHKLIPMPSVKDVFSFVREKPGRLGVVPIENSSGGTIRDTVEALTGNFYPHLFIQESLAVNVRLALLGHDKKHIRVIYSHFAPLHHCETWLRTNFPNAELFSEQSTATAVKKAAGLSDAAAIGAKEAAKRYGLKVLEFPIESGAKNVTRFFVFGQNRGSFAKNSRTTVLVSLPNTPGSLYDFLEPFKNRGVNLTRLISQPVIGKPDTYVFLLDLAGSDDSKNIIKALDESRKIALTVKNIGSYPVRPAYNS
jgi:chorismate mutase / prephenate dehydratase